MDYLKSIIGYYSENDKALCYVKKKSGLPGIKLILKSLEGSLRPRRVTFRR